jgi:hypothetical protein
VHKKDRDRTIKKTEWKDEIFTEKKIEFRPVRRVFKTTVLETRKKRIPKIRYVTKTIKQRKIVNKQMTRFVKKIEM